MKPATATRGQQAAAPEPTRNAHPNDAEHEPDGRIGLPRFLQPQVSAATSAHGEPRETALHIQRDDDGTTPDVKPFELSPPSLLQPRDPLPRFHLTPALQLHLDDDLKAKLGQQLRFDFSPDRIITAIGQQAAAPPSPAVAGLPGATPAATGPDPNDPEVVKTARPGTGGDVLGAAVKTPQGKALLGWVQDQTLSGLERLWSDASTAGKVGYISGSVVIAGSMLTPLLAYRGPREAVLPLLSGVVLPVPGLTGYGLEYQFAKDGGIVLGVHADLGQYLPKALGFGPAKLKSFDTPFEPGAGLPPGQSTGLARKEADGADSAAPSAGFGTRLHAALGSGSALPAAARSEFESFAEADVSDVRVHTDARADGLAREAHAHAFTTGRDIFFRADAWNPDSRSGARLLAHELTHTLQQAAPAAVNAGSGSGISVSHPGDPQEREADAAADAMLSGGTMPSPTVAAPQAQLMRSTDLASIAESTRQTLRFDDLKNTSKLADFIDLKGDPKTADNISESFEISSPTIDALTDDKVKTKLYRGLRAYVRGVFDLQPGDDGKASAPRLNLVRIEHLDLSRWSGPDATFRFSAIGTAKASGTYPVQLLVEEIGAPQQPMTQDTASDIAANKAADDAASKGNGDPLADLPKASDVVTERIEKAKATPNGIKRGSAFPDPYWKKVMRSLDKLNSPMLQHLKDVTFETSASAKGADGEPASFDSHYDKGKGTWVRTITLYTDMTSADDAGFAWLLAHEISHAIDFVPAEGAKGATGASVHDSAGFKAAAAKDGGRNKAVTTYAGTADKEFFAECFAMYVQQPDTMKLLRPNLYAWFLAYDAVATPAATTPATPATTPAAKAAK